ncbi:hypothetical protein ACIRP2_39285 [Streptomyces sp. NPDC101194]|uniref:hypothetical protein n=1 Tax=Streptomyces sp. NPDC101194 TaxID=3366127 RepID=UPI003819E221
MFTILINLDHPLSPRRRLPRAVLVIAVLAVLWAIDPEYVDTIATWVGLVAVLLPAGGPSTGGVFRPRPAGI